MSNFDTSFAAPVPRLRRALLACAGLAPLWVGLCSPQAGAQSSRLVPAWGNSGAPALAPNPAQAPKLVTNWATVQQLAKGQAMQYSGSLRLAVPAVAAPGSITLTIGSELPTTTLLALFVQTQGLLVQAPLTPAQSAQPPVVSAEQMGLRSMVAVFDTSHPDTKAEFSLPIKLERTSRFYLVAIASGAAYLVEAETKLALLQRK